VFNYFKKQFPKAKKLPLVYTLVIYNGKKRYTPTTDFFQLFHEPKLARQLFTNPHGFIDLSTVEDETLALNPVAGTFQYFMKHIYATPFEKHLEMGFNLLRALNKDELADHIETIICYTSNKARFDNKLKFIESIAEELDPDIGKKVMTFAETFIAHGKEKGVQVGISQGIAKGMSQGIAKGIKTVAKKLLRKKVDLQLIAESTDLTIEQIQALEKEEA